MSITQASACAPIWAPMGAQALPGSLRRWMGAAGAGRTGRGLGWWWHCQAVASPGFGALQILAFAVVAGMEVGEGERFYTLKLAIFPALISRLVIRHGHQGQRWSQRCWVLGVRGFGQGSAPIVRAGCGKTLPRGAQRRGKCFPNAFPCGLEQLCCLGARLGQRRCLGAAAGRAALGAGGPLPTPGKSAPGVGGHVQGCRGCPALAVSQHSCCGVFWVPGTDLGEAQAKGLWCPGSRGGGEAHEALCDGGCVHAHLSDPKRETA